MATVTVNLTLRDILVRGDIYSEPAVWVVRLMYTDADQPNMHRYKDRFPGEGDPLVPWVFEDVYPGTYVPEAAVFDSNGYQLGLTLVGEPFKVVLATDVISIPASLMVSVSPD